MDVGFCGLGDMGAAMVTRASSKTIRSACVNGWRTLLEQQRAIRVGKVDGG